LAFICFAGEGLWLAMMPWVRTWRMRKAAAQAPAQQGSKAEAANV
jgi:hypothetical protein